MKNPARADGQWQLGDILYYFSSTSGLTVKVQILAYAPGLSISSYYVQQLDNNNTFYAYESELNISENPGLPMSGLKTFVDSLNSVKVPNHSMQDDYEVDWSGIIRDSANMAPRDCDCGAWKTYGKEEADSAGLHSHWCAVVKEYK